YISNRTICLLCGFEPSIIKKFVIDRHFRRCHSVQYSNYSDTEKLNIIEALKLVYQDDVVSSPPENSSEKPLLASYAISLLIGQNSKPFTDGTFIKNCIIEAVKSFGNSLTIDEAMSIPLSAKTITFSYNRFDTCFTCFEKLRTELILFENPLTAPIEEQHLDLQDELCDLHNDISLKTVKETGADFYKILSHSSYPKLRNFGLRIYSMFGSTYLCETSFSKMKFIKNEKRSSLSDNSLPRLMRLATSNIDIDVPSLVSKKSRKSSDQ
ncbi:General transcription factor II-I repeat domain-containing protein 2B, partial [Ooceraea biroi]